MARLKKMISGSYQTIPLPMGVTRIGRSTSCELKLQSPLVSKLHAVIECDSDGCSLKNESSKGTTVNGHKLINVTRLQDGDEIQMGLDVLVFLLTEESSAGDSSGSGKLYRGDVDDPDDSIRHFMASPGRPVDGGRAGRTFRDYGDKICGRISLREQSLASLATTDSVRKLSQVLRITEMIHTCPPSGREPAVFDLLYQFFPQATQVVIAEDASSTSGKLRVSATDCRDGERQPLICEDVIQHVARKRECLLLVDQWREAPTEKPRLSTMGRVSMMCVPMQAHSGSGCGVIQMLGGVPGSEFRIGDLERLAILAQLLTIAMPPRFPDQVF